MSETRAAEIIAFDANEGEVTPNWKYKLRAKITPGRDGSPFSYVEDGIVTEERLDYKIAAAQKDVDYLKAAKTALLAKIEETENAS